MSLKYGLNVKKAAPAQPRKTIFDDDDGEDDQQPNQEAAVEEISSFGGSRVTGPPNRKDKTKPLKEPLSRDSEEDARQDISSAQASRAHVKAAEELDPSIFDYDSFHDAKTSVSEAKKAAAKKDAIDRKPQYINNLLDAAARRKQDQMIAKEKMLQKEREAEGDEFADKEKFVTGAYKQQQEEARRLEEEEKKKADDEEERRRQQGGGMRGFYKGLMDQQEQQHREAVDAAAKMETNGGSKTGAVAKEQSDAEVAAEMRQKGINVHLNEEGQITDKRELLSAGLNVAPAGKGKEGSGAEHLKTSARPAQFAFQNRNDSGRQAQRERQSKMMEEQLAAQAKRAREEEEEERQRVEKAAKSSKSEKDVSDAKKRFLARKAAKERGEG
jgi:coiled-coil domain-containing protein 55